MPSLKRGPNCKAIGSSKKFIGEPVMDKKFQKKTEKLKNTYMQFKDKVPQYEKVEWLIPGPEYLITRQSLIILCEN